MDAEKWGQVVSAIHRGGDSAATAKWEACQAATAKGPMMVPFPECNPEGWTHQKHVAIEHMRGVHDVDELRSAAQMFPVDFAVWRTHCHDLEAKNAARLQVLVWVLQILYKMRTDPDLAEIAGTMADKVANTLDRHWGIRSHDIPIDSPYREWCTKVTRNYRMLPKLWRYL